MDLSSFISVGVRGCSEFGSDEWMDALMIVEYVGG